MLFPPANKVLQMINFSTIISSESQSANYFGLEHAWKTGQTIDIYLQASAAYSAVQLHNKLP